MIAGIVASADTDLFLPMLVPFLAGITLSAAQLTSHSSALALLFPWRVSVLLVPLSTAVLVRGAIAWSGVSAARSTRAIAAALIVISMIAGSVRMLLNFA